MGNLNETGLSGWKLVLLWIAAGFMIALASEWRAVITWLELHDKLAGWAQAVGSVAAIFGAFHIANGQHTRELRRSAAERDDRAAAERKMLLEAVRHIEVLASASDDYFQKSGVAEVSLVFKEMIDHMRAPLDSLPFWTGENQDMLIEASKIRAFCLNVAGAPDAKTRSEDVMILSRACIRFRERFARDSGPRA